MTMIHLKFLSLALLLLAIYLSLPCTTAAYVKSQSTNSDKDAKKDYAVDTSKIEPKQSPQISSTGSISLTTLTLDENLSDGNVWLIEFFAPWCSHCQAFANSYETVAHKVHSNPSSKTKQGRVAKIDGHEERATASRFNIVGYPSFFVVDGWSVYEYKGSRTVDALVNYVQGGYKKDDVSNMVKLFRLSFLKIMLFLTAMEISKLDGTSRFTCALFINRLSLCPFGLHPWVPSA